MLRNGLQTVIRTIYPPECMGCGALAETEHALCGTCWRDAHFVGAPSCDQCGIPLIGDAKDKNSLCDACLQSPRAWRKGRAVFVYEGTGRKLVLALKHGDRHDLARPAANWMAKVAPRQRGDSLIVPVPLHWTRFVKRRFNQSALLGVHVARALGLEHLPDALVRTHATPSLDGKTREERFECVAKSISINPKHAEKLIDREVLLIDDVMTSGATLSACAEACVSSGARNVDVLVLARVARDTYVR